MTTENRPSSEIRLPRIDIPKFDGNFTDFLGFWDLFKTAVDTNSSYSDSQKLWYLKASLTGEAANLIKNFNTEDANYDIAKNILEKRYLNKNRIAREHMRRFLSQPSISSPTAENLKYIHDTSNEVIRGLKILEMESRDAWLIHIILEKLDTETRRAWAEKCEALDDNTIDFDIETFLSFLECRFGTFEFSQPMQAHTPKVNKTSLHDIRFSTCMPQIPEVINAGGKSFALTNPITKFKCRFCQRGTHSVFNCRTFNRLALLDRIKIVQNMKLCKNCLHPSHNETGICKKGICKKCNSSKHHTLLHNKDHPFHNFKSNNNSSVSLTVEPEINAKPNIQPSIVPSLCFNATTIPNGIQKTIKACHNCRNLKHLSHSSTQLRHSSRFTHCQIPQRQNIFHTKTEFQSAGYFNFPTIKNLQYNNGMYRSPEWSKQCFNQNHQTNVTNSATSQIIPVDNWSCT